MKIKKPLHNFVIIQRLEETESRYGSIILPDMGKESNLIGKIIAVGDGAWDNTGKHRIEMSVVEGDIVLFPSFGPTKINIGTEEYITCRDSELITLLEE